MLPTERENGTTVCAPPLQVKIKDDKAGLRCTSYCVCIDRQPDTPAKKSATKEVAVEEVAVEEAVPGNSA